MISGTQWTPKKFEAEVRRRLYATGDDVAIRLARRMERNESEKELWMNVSGADGTGRGEPGKNA